ncbi:hypothetical protein J4433_00930 [Candidatus Pacearchaeota archaeon]|nr:hypothetical protein [Candidatus Pacearchaeota archaeon]
MKKNAQFYIIVSAIIIMVVTGLITILNYVVVRPEPIQFYDLSKQLEREATKVIDYGVYTGGDIPAHIEDFITNFLKYAHEKDPEIGLIYIYGNATSLIVANYGKDDAGVVTELNKTVLYGSEAESISQIRMDIAGQQVGKKIIEEKGIFGNIKTVLGPSKLVRVNISNKIYDFDLKGQQYFFAIVKSESEGETYYSLIE